MPVGVEQITRTRAPRLNWTPPKGLGQAGGRKGTGSVTPWGWGTTEDTAGISGKEPECCFLQVELTVQQQFGMAPSSHGKKSHSDEASPFFSFKAHFFKRIILSDFICLFIYLFLILI